MPVPVGSGTRRVPGTRTRIAIPNYEKAIVGYNVCFPILVQILYCHVEYVVLHCGLHVRVVSGSSPLYGYGQPQWWAHGCLYDR
jgi:hypothetical protein